MFFWPCIMNWLYINYQLWCTDYYLFIKYYIPLHVSSLKCLSSGGYSCTHAAYGTVTLYESSWWPVGTHSVLTQAVYRQATTNSHREWQYHMLHVHNCILLKMSTWGSKHVEENNILWINNNQCIKLVINIQSMQSKFHSQGMEVSRSEDFRWILCNMTSDLIIKYILPYFNFFVVIDFVM